MKYKHFKCAREVTPLGAINVNHI